MSTFIHIRRSELNAEEPEKQKLKIPKNLLEAYKRDLLNIDNIIIFAEFLKEFLSIILHKYQYENLVEDMYSLYSDMLDEFYKNTSKENSDSPLGSPSKKG